MYRRKQHGNFAAGSPTKGATSNTSPAKVAHKLEVVVIPVSDVDRAKEFYARLGWRLDADYDNGNDFRVIQFTPPGSGCSVIFGKNVTAAAPGSAQGLYLIVSDIAAARDELLASRRRGQRGVPRRRRRVCRPGRALPVWAPPGQRSGSRASQLPLVRLIQRSGRQRLAAAGDHDAAARSHRPPRHDVRVGERPVAGAAARGGRPREHEARIGQADPNWPDWYAEYMVREQAGEELPQMSGRPRVANRSSPGRRSSCSAAARGSASRRPGEHGPRAPMLFSPAATRNASSTPHASSAR